VFFYFVYNLCSSSPSKLVINFQQKEVARTPVGSVPNIVKYVHLFLFTPEWEFCLSATDRRVSTAC
jgi:hypothetical protein